MTASSPHPVPRRSSLGVRALAICLMIALSAGGQAFGAPMHDAASKHPATASGATTAAVAAAMEGASADEAVEACTGAHCAACFACLTGADPVTPGSAPLADIAPIRQDPVARSRRLYRPPIVSIRA